MNYSVYILWNDLLKKFYVGSTGNLQSRLMRHNRGSVKFTSKGLPWKLIWEIKCANRPDAFTFEMKIKKEELKDF